MRTDDDGPEVRFDPVDLAAAIESGCPDVLFCFLLGSGAGGVVKPGSDLDIAAFLSEKGTFAIYHEISEVASSVVPDRTIDLGFLNDAEPVYRFEALSGRLLFTRDRDAYLQFFSLTCREYESQIADYRIQRRYRIEYAPRG